MYAYIKGIIADLAEDNLVLEGNNIGYNIRIPLSVAQRLPGIGATIKIYTYTSVREDAFNLFGFLSQDDLEIYKKLIDDSIQNLSKGNGVSVAFKGHWAFPSTAYEMLLTGEKTGKLGEMMEHVAVYYQEEQTNLIARLKSLIEPIMIVLLAVLVGIILLAVVVPMFDIYSTII